MYVPAAGRPAVAILPFVPEAGSTRTARLLSNRFGPTCQPVQRREACCEAKEIERYPASQTTNRAAASWNAATGCASSGIRERNGIQTVRLVCFRRFDLLKRALQATQDQVPDRTLCWLLNLRGRRRCVQSSRVEGGASEKAAHGQRRNLFP